MSAPTDQTNLPEEWTKELPTGTILLVALGCFVLFFGGIFWATTILHRTSDQLAPDMVVDRPHEVSQVEIGIVDQQLFGLPSPYLKLREEKHAHLGSYGWTDKQRGLVHVPIEKAMELVEGGRKP